MSRARDTSQGATRDVFIAEDDMTDALVCLLRIPPQSHYTVVAAVFLDRFESRGVAADALKEDVPHVLWRTAESAAVHSALRRWQIIRFAAIARGNLPFLLLGLSAGVLLGIAVALFSVWTEFVGWPIVAAGIVMGAAAGFLLKMAVEAYRAKAVAGPWGRFAIIMLGAIIGAGAAAGGGLLLFWH